MKDTIAPSGPIEAVPFSPSTARGEASPLLQRRRRGWELGLPMAIDTSTGFYDGRHLPAIIAVGGGKGGVGKSLLCANLAARLATGGLKVLAVDLDIGGANLHTYFGVGAPTHMLGDAIIFHRKSLREVMVPTAIDGLRLIAGGREETWGDTSSIDRSVIGSLYGALLAVKEQDGIDIVILDLGAGTHRHTIDFFLSAHLGIVTVLPEPTSIENAYLFLKTALFRIIENVGERTGATETADAVKCALMSEPSGGRARTAGYVDKLRQIANMHPGFVNQLGQALLGRTCGIAVNQVRSQKDIDVGRSMELIGERYFGFQSKFCGYLTYDEAAWKSLRNRRLLVADFPHAVLSRRFVELARTVLGNIGF